MKTKYLLSTLLLFMLLLTGCDIKPIYTNYTIQIYIENNKGTYDLNDSITVQQEAGQEYDIPAFVGYNINIEKSDMIDRASEDAVIKLYYDLIEKDEYFLRIYRQTGDVLELEKSYTCSEGTLVEFDAKEYVGLDFMGWFQDDDLISADDRFTFEMGSQPTSILAKYQEIEVLISTIELNGVTEETVGDQFDMDITVEPYNYTEKYNWASSDESIAIVNDSGMVTVLKVGTVSIVAYTDTVTATYTFNVKETTSMIDYKELNTGEIAAGYIYRNYSELSDEVFDTMDILYPSFINPDINGGFSGLNADQAYVDIWNNKIKKYISEYVIDRAHEKGVYVVVSLGGGGSAAADTFAIIAADAALRKTFVKNVVTLINENKYDGVDIDWETPTTETKHNFTLLMSELYTAIKANNPHHLLTAAIGGGKWTPKKFELDQSKEYIDYINMMTYGMCKNNGYYQNALYKASEYNNIDMKAGKTLVSCSIDESVEIYNSYGVKNSQIIVGLAFYGISQTRNSTAADLVGAGSILFDALNTANYISNPTYQYVYDEVAQVPYLISMNVLQEDGEYKDGLQFISYDNSRSIKAKCSYVKENQLAGVMNWEIGCDTNNILLQAIADSYSK